MKFENIKTYNFGPALKGMRNPLESWDKSDSEYKYENIRDSIGTFVIGSNDLKLMQSLIKAGTDHSKFMRMINVTMDITAPMYWAKEMDTYKIGTVRNSCSTMHKIHDKEFTINDFSHEHLDGNSLDLLNDIIIRLNDNRKHYLETKDKDYWWQLIQLLPSSYNQKFTWQANYAVLRNIYFSRKNHRLDEWIHFTEFILSLPYAKELITIE